MAETSAAENREMYRSYIQRRRVIPEKTENDLFTGYDEDKKDDPEDSQDPVSESEPKALKSAITDAEELSILREKYMPEEEFSGHLKKPDENNRSSPFRLFGQRNALSRQDTYRRYPSYGYTHSAYGRTASRLPAYGRSFRGQAGRTSVEDNRITLLAKKVIKQTLVCFVLLGIIVFMQQKADLADELSLIKKNVVENHIELDSIINGVKNIVAECTKIFGGSP